VALKKVEKLKCPNLVKLSWQCSIHVLCPIRMKMWVGVKNKNKHKINETFLKFEVIFKFKSLLRISNEDTFDFLLNPLFFGYSTEKLKTIFFKIRKFLPFLYSNLKWRAKFQISGLLKRDSDWLNFIHFTGYSTRLG